MPIEFMCSGCGNALRVPDEQAGRQAKCPVCEQITTIPSAGPRSEEAAQSESEPTPTTEPPDVAQPAQSVGVSSGSLRPHRGVSILIFGICSLFCCGLLGIVAWVMANEDLALMERGVMDPTGQGMTMAGKVLGIIGLFVLIAGSILPLVLSI